jgi:hypothetical protein
MSASTAIGLVSASLRTLLVEELELNLTVDVTVLAPDEPAGDRRINLFLYRVEENPFLRNQEAVLHAGAGRLVPPPLSLSLYYLLTAYAPNDAQTGNATAHQILGEAMRILHENPVLPRGYLDPGLLDAREDLRITNTTLDPEELSRIWSTFAQPFRLSVLYQVCTVQLDVAPGRWIEVPDRVRRVGVPDIRQPLDRPVIEAMSPGEGAAGTTITFRGAHLAGWRTVIRFGGRIVFDNKSEGDELTATVPTDAEPGRHDVRVDVAGLFRRTFGFEVTA